MNLKLQDLEAVLPPDIVQKGLDYYAANRVDHLAEQDHKWQANVQGTHTYKVTLEIREDEVLNWYCNCPYDFGPICKHVAAVLFAIRTERAEADLAKMPYFKKSNLPGTKEHQKTKK